MIRRVFTLGVYGTTEEQFFSRLTAAGVNVFCDIRQRRGVRGSQYRFVNSTYLQREIAERGIEYRYLPELAPSQEIREEQRRADAQLGVLKRARQELSEEFRKKYITEILGKFDVQRFNHSFDSSGSNVLLFCVETNPFACHRSLAADRIHQELGTPVTHL